MANSGTAADAGGKDGAVVRTETGTETSVGDEAANPSADAPADTHKTSHLPQYCAGAMACMISLINGYSYGWPSVAQPLLQSAASPLASGALGAETASWVASLLYLTALAALPGCTWLGGRCGRKPLGYAAAALLFLQFLVLAATRDVVGLLAARALAGVAGALLFPFTPCYTREISEDAIRGSIGSFMSLFFNIGVLVVYSVGGVLSYEVYSAKLPNVAPCYTREISENAIRRSVDSFMSLFNAGVLAVYRMGGVLSYEALNLLGLALTCAYVLGFWWLPETPPHLVARGKTAEAERALRWLRGPRADVAAELRALERTVKRRRADDATSLAQLLRDKASVRGLLLCCTLCANQPLCGFFVVLSYAVEIFTEASPDISAHLAASIVGVQCVLGSLLTARLVERLGRKALFLASDGAMAVCLAALGAYSYLKATGADVSHLGWVPVASLSVFMAAVTLAITTLPFVIVTEIFLPQAQQLATLLGALLIMFFGFFATKFFTSIVQFFGLHVCYWFFSAMCAIIAVYLYIALPETKGRSLESIRRELAGEKEEEQLPQTEIGNAQKESV